MLSLIGSYVAVLLRAWLVLFFLERNPLALWPIGAMEIFAVYSTCIGLWRLPYDEEPSALVVPLCYCAPLMFRAEGAPVMIALALFAIAGVGQLIIRCYMGFNLNIGSAMFRELLDKGPYKYVRHPLALTEITMSALFPCVYPTAWNIYWSITAVACGITAAYWEEGYLRTIKRYRAYKKDVRFMFIPKVW